MPGLLRLITLAARSPLTFMPMTSLTSPMSRTSKDADTEALTIWSPSRLFTAAMRSST